MLVVTDFSMTSALSQPIIDYKNHIINLDTASCRQTLAYEKEFRTTGSGICFGCAFCWGRCADRNVLGKKKEE